MTAQRILVPVDFSDGSKAALAAADAMAKSAGASLTLLHVHPMTVVSVLDYTYAEPPELVAEAVQAITERLDKWAAELDSDASKVKTEVRTGQPATEILDAAADHDLIIMGTHGRSGVDRFLMGSVAERVVRGAKCSVLVHR